MKKILSLLLSLAMLLSITGGLLSTTACAEAVTPAQQAIADRKAEAAKTGKYEQVVFAFFNWTGQPAGTARIQEKINERLRETLGLEVELLVLDSASYKQNVRLMLSSGEQVDIFNSNPFGYTTCINDGYCLNLEENDLIQTYGQGILNTLNPAYVQACRINSVLYGLPQLRDMAMGAGAYCIGQEYLDGIGFDYDSLYADPSNKDIIYTDYDTIETIFAQLHEKYPDKYVFAVGDNLINQGTTIDNVGGDFFGVLLDPANSLKVENLYTSEQFKASCERIRSWYLKGYISQDAITDDTALSARVKAGSNMSMMAQAKPGYSTQISGECGRKMIVFQVEPDIMKSGAVTGILWHLNQGCENPAAAMQVLDAFYTDPVVSNLIIWGEENVDYVMTDDGHITFPEGVNADNSEWYHTMNWLLPNQYIAHIWQGDPLDLWERMEQFNSDSVKSKALGFTFDNSAYSSEFSALTNVYDEYAKQLLFGFVDPETGIAEMEAKLEAAGLMTYIAAKQEALDAWAAANGIQ